ncbi:DUF6075 family protein [Psychrobacillus sp. FSL K6-1267]|uniref:DUF6075 family protein n=1 Tax=Psychrobacillus sp. FSL K6-1267 TaxID=2921543 RepID=UPI0030F5FDF6
MYLFPCHQRNYQELLKRDKTHPQDIERNAMFYIFSGNSELLEKMIVFYDFENGMIRTEGFQEVKLSSSATALVKLAFNLYNNFACGTVVDLFANLDEKNCYLALEAIRLRFSIK